MLSLPIRSDSRNQAQYILQHKTAEFSAGARHAAPQLARANKLKRSRSFSGLPRSRNNNHLSTAPPLLVRCTV
jgi:hypothetical protein